MASRPESQNPGLWMVPGDRGRYVGDFVAGGYAGVDSTVDLSGLPSVGRYDELRTRYERQHPDKTRSQIGEPVSYLDGVLDMAEGDYVLTWERVPDRIQYGQVVGPWYFLEKTDRCPYRNRRSVQWSETVIPTRRLSGAFREKLGVGGTRVFRVPFWAEFREVADLPSLGTATGAEGPGSRRSSLAELKVAPGAALSRSESPAQSSELRDAPTSGADTQVIAPPNDSTRIDDDGIEEEAEDPDSETADTPFDPTRIQVRTIPVLVEQIMSRIAHHEIDLSPDFQRLRGIWSIVDRSRLVESLLLRIPIPAFYVAADEKDHWQVVDGVQRISTLDDFVGGRFALKKLQYLSHFDGKHYTELPRSMQRRISETPLTVNVIEPGTPQEVMFNIFHRINTGGLTLNGQEIRNALNPGPAREYLARLAISEEFLAATGGKVSPKRMADRECVLRFMAFRMEPWEQYSAESLDAHLGWAMRLLNSTSPEQREQLDRDFRQAMHTAAQIFGRYAFRKRYSTDEDWLRPINRALFESWSVQLARCSPEERQQLVGHGREIRRRSIALLTDDAEFEKAVSLSTGTAQRIMKRFSAVRDLVEDVLSC